jgi:hypothetical protein
MDGLTIGPDGILFGLQEGSYGLFMINPDSAEATLVGPTGISIGGFNATGGLAFGPDGMLYAANDSALYVVDPRTAASRHVGNVGWNDVQGITFLGCDQVDPVALQAGDANQDLRFDGADLAQVLAAAKYLTGQTATWGEGDWNGAPGGGSGNPPAGNGLFDQFDVVAALQGGVYLAGPYQALRSDGKTNEERVSLAYDTVTGEVAVDMPGDNEMTSIDITANAAIFEGTCFPPSSLCLEIDGPILTRNSFSDGFGSFSFGAVARTGLEEEFLLNDVTIIGSFAEGGEIGDVDLIFVPEPVTAVPALLGVLSVVLYLAHIRRTRGYHGFGECLQKFTEGQKRSAETPYIK